MDIIRLEKDEPETILGDVWDRAWLDTACGVSLGLCRKRTSTDDGWLVHFACETDSLFPLWAHGVGCFGVRAKVLADDTAAQAVAMVLADAPEGVDVADRLDRAFLDLEGQLSLEGI